MYYGERFNAYSHLSGVILAVAATVLLVLKSIGQGELAIWAASVYGGTLIFLYLISTLYHSIKPELAKTVLQKFDHCAIYLLIAGSYTPFTLITLNGPWGWSLFGVSWGLALFGIIQELTIGLRSPTRWLSMLIYVLMGWLVVVAIMPLLRGLESWGLFWLVAGGVAYSGGIYWFIQDTKIKHGHGIWHMFVLMGSLFQFFCIYFYVL
ncbi:MULTISPECIES: PAQR family membrane homeostasis protein TrhA [Vitreoscilla]|uniref:Hemolysin III family protein n=1 Tax=Vitreoscilla stercoraria TaxID=61 RepID=A0ABY4EAH2_VITST|nr:MULTISPECIES: hemolysin III family protein [Vitreoscilla]QJQ52443.1 hemolysin-3 related protein [Vitreoscilla sp. C1]UOO92447.1 hemolysin III family protein [Vitreoscilla stercoraria]